MSIRLGFTNGANREPGVGRHLGLFHMVSVRETGGRVVSVPGYLRFDRSDLEPFREKGVRLRVTVVGVLRLDPDVSPALAESVLDLRLYGRLIADHRTAAVLKREPSPTR